MNLLEIVRTVGKRPAFYLGDLPRNRFSIWHLHSFLTGWSCGSYGRPKQDGDDVLDSLTFWVCTRYRVPDGALNWAGHLWRQSGEDDEAAFRLFFEVFEEYVRDRQQHGADAIKAKFMEMLNQRR